MERNYRMIIAQHLKNLHADVTMAAASTFTPGSTVAKLKPDFFRLAYLASGEAKLRLGECRYDARAGHLFLLPAGIEQSYDITGTETCVLLWCHFEANLGDAELLHTMKLPVCVDMAGRSDIMPLFQSLIASFNDPAITSTLRVKAALFEILACYLEQCEVDANQFGNLDLYMKMSDVLTYIDEHLADNMTLEDLARIAFLHPNYFISLFKNMIGYSPIQYVNLQRLEAAKRLLAQTDLHVAEVAASVGMQNHYLSRLFKQHTGISPSRYRQLYRENCSGIAAGTANTAAALAVPSLTETAGIRMLQQFREAESHGRPAAAEVRTAAPAGAGSGVNERRKARNRS